jgi:Asp-tRNA(Asn)/Glu-tRNA(Gln) amidotransferase A subunit family amidase
MILMGLGTDTVNSLRSPASANSLFSVRPTRGLISRAGIVPISYTQDVIGPIARSVKDLAVALTVMASVGYDAADNTTAFVPDSVKGVDYSASLYGGSLKGLRIGVLEGFFNRTNSSETTPVNTAMADMISVLQKAGATTISINETVYNATAIGALDVQRSEYRELLDAYLASSSGVHPQTMTELYTNSTKFVVLPSQYSYVNTALVSSTSNTSYAQNQLLIRNLTTTIASTFTTNNLDAIIYPEQKNLAVKLGSPSQSGRNGILAALTSSPVVTIPAGFSAPSADAPIGVPIGMEILGRPWSEEKLLGIASQLSGLRHVRKMPVFANQSVETRTYNEVPAIKPLANIPSEYPVGVL